MLSLIRPWAFVATGLLFPCVPTGLASGLSEVELSLLRPEKAIGGDVIPPLAEPMGRTVCIDITGDFLADGIVMVGNTPVFMINPGVLMGSVTFPELVQDIAPAPRCAPPGWGALAACSQRGLELWWVDEAKALQVDSIGGPQWQQVRRLISGEVGASDQFGFAGISGDGLALHFMQDARGERVESTLPLTAEAYEIALLQYDDQPGSEIAMFTSEGTKIIDMSGNVLWQISVGDENSVMAVLREEGCPQDRLAAIIALDAQGNEWLFTRDEVGYAEATYIGIAQSVGLTSGDFDADGKDDLVFTHKYSSEVGIFLNRGSFGSTVKPFTFAEEVFIFADPTSNATGSEPAPDNESIAAVCDLDGDGDADVLAPVEKEGHVVLLRSTAELHGDYAPDLPYGDIIFDPVAQHSDLVLHMWDPMVVGEHTAGLEYTIYHQAHEAADVDSVPEAHGVIALTEGFPEDIRIHIEGNLETSALRHVVVRCVSLDPVTKTVTGAGPPWVYTCCLQQQVALSFAALEEVPPESLIPLFIHELEEGCDSSTEDLPPGEEGSSSVPGPCVPPFDPDGGLSNP